MNSKTLARRILARTKKEPRGGIATLYIDGNTITHYGAPIEKAGRVIRIVVNRPEGAAHG